MSEMERLPQLLILLVTSALLVTAGRAAAKTPVVLVPGDGGSQIWASLDKASNHWYCEKSTSSPTLVWLQIVDLVFPAVNCLAYNLELKFDANSGRTRDNDGVTIHIPGFGHTATVEYLSNVHFSSTNYYGHLVDHLVKNMGYTRGVDVHGAPFDFRKAPDEMSDYFLRLTELIESTYTNNGNSPVVLVGHSLGCKYLLHFLHTKTREWKRKFVKSFVSAAGPFGGAASSMLALVSGYNLGLDFIRPLWFRDAQRSWPSTYYLLPSALIFNASAPLVETPRRNYTLHKADLRDMFADMNFNVGFAELESLRNLTNQTKAPEVPTYCVYGHGLKTPSRFKFARQSDFPDSQPHVVHGDGDGTVNIDSLSVCMDWSSRQSEPVVPVPVEGAEHVKLLAKQEFVQAVVDAIDDNLLHLRRRWNGR